MKLIFNERKTRFYDDNTGIDCNGKPFEWAIENGRVQWGRHLCWYPATDQM
jgi:hypothetical protein